MSPPLSSTASVLFAQATRAPEQPWFFFRPELDWRWHSWSQVAAAVKSHGVSLETLPPRCRVAWRPRIEPSSLALGLAIEASGRWSVPLEPCLQPGTEEALRGCGAWVFLTGEEAPKDLPDTLQVLEISPGLGSPGGTAKIEGDSLERLVSDLTGGATLSVADDRHEAVGQADLARAAEKSFGFLSPAPRRDVLVAGPPAGGKSLHLAVAGSALLGAALVLEPEEAAWPATLRWVRPTLLAGSVAEIRRARKALGEPRRRRSRWPWGRQDPLKPPWDRLRGVVVFGEEPLEAEEVAHWRELGVEVAGDS